MKSSAVTKISSTGNSGSGGAAANPLPAPAPGRRPSLRLRWLGAVWKFHRWLGLLFALPLFVVCVSGALLVRYDWVERVADPALFRSAGDSAPRLPLGALLARLATDRPAAQVRFVELPGDPRRNVAVTVFEPGDRRTVILDAATGAVRLERAEQDGPRRWLLRLHEALLLGRWGEFTVALSSLALLAAALSGLWIYRGAWRGLWRPQFRWRKGPRLWLGDAHKFIGILSLALLLVWGLTGALLTLPTLPRLFTAPRPEPPASPAYDWTAAPALEPLLAAAQQQFPAAQLDYLSLPARPGGHFTVSLIDRERWLWAKFKEVEFTAEGAFLRAQDFAHAGALDRVNFTVTVLHFGHQGSAAMRWTWLILGFAPALLIVSGSLIWWRRSHRTPLLS